MIELADAIKVFHAGQPNEFTALRGITLTLDAGRMTVFRGPSGSGKTTLLSLIGGMARPTSGRIHLMGREITSLPERFLTDIRRRTFGFIFQHFNLVRGVSALENVMLPAFPTGERRAALKSRALALLDHFGLAARSQAKIEHLSGGEVQRVTIARALINSPLAVIADEPTAHLDSRLSIELMDLLGRLKSEGKTVLIASHDPIVAEAPAVDRVVDLRDGRIESPG